MNKIIIADANGTIDSAYHTLVRHINSPVPIVMVSWSEIFVFNEELLNIKDYVLVCFCEYGYDFKLINSHIWGVNSESFDRYYHGDWIRFDNWVKQNRPIVLFKRELLKKDVIGNIHPIDYPACVEPIAVQSQQEFNARPISAAYYFGRSHEDRLRLHSDIWRMSGKYGYSVCDNPFQFWGLPKFNLGSFLENEKGKKYVSMHIPHWFRLPIENILSINGLAKIGIVPFGAGQKTFRAAEVSANAVMLMWEDDLAWAADWIHGFNCLKCKPGDEVATIEEWSNNDNLYTIYQESVKTWDKYRTSRYTKEYLEPIING